MANANYVLQGGVELLEHPDVVALRNKVITNYKPSPKAKIALFAPCAKTKPYTHSRTHKAIDTVIREVCKTRSISPKIIDIIVISEPIGVIPRKWELYYPAMNYEMTLTTWFPLDKINQSKDRGCRNRTFAKSAEILKNRKENSTSEYVIQFLSDIIALFLMRYAEQYDYLLGYVRSTHRTMLERASNLVGTYIDIVPTHQQIQSIIKLKGRLHWVFQGLRGNLSMKILQEKLGQILDAINV